jgi:SufS family cysteine desulfurase
MTFKPEAFRRQFPLFCAPENQSLVYLDNAATTQKPASVIDAVADFYRQTNANAHRASHRLGRQATDIIEAARMATAQFIGAASAQEIVFTRGATEAINLVAQGLSEQFYRGDEILLTQAEHHANLIPWQSLAQRQGLTLKFLPSVNGVPEFHRLGEFIGPKTKLFACTAASNVLGFKTPLQRLKAELADTGIYWLVDGAQLLPHEGLNVADIGCDYLVASAHKCYGPSGVGFLWGRARLLDQLAPWQLGGQMVASVELHTSHYQLAPLRFEAGTPPLAAIAGLKALWEFWQSIDRPGMHLHEQSLLRRLHKGLAAMDGITVFSALENNVGVVSFSAEAVDDASFAWWLDGHDIAVRAGHHCAQPLLQSLGQSGSVRASLAGYSTQQEVDYLLERVEEGLRTLAHSNSVSVASTLPESTDLSQFSMAQLEQQPGWQKKYRLLMRWGQQVPEQPRLRVPANKVTGCESDTWLDGQSVDGQWQFSIDSDATVVKGLGVVLLLLVQGKTRQEILALDIHQQFQSLSLQRHLSPSRMNGLLALWQRIQTLVTD